MITSPPAGPHFSHEKWGKECQGKEFLSPGPLSLVSVILFSVSAGRPQPATGWRAGTCCKSCSPHPPSLRAPSPQGEGAFRPTARLPPGGKLSAKQTDEGSLQNSLDLPNLLSLPLRGRWIRRSRRRREFHPGRKTPSVSASHCQLPRRGSLFCLCNASSSTSKKRPWPFGQGRFTSVLIRLRSRTRLRTSHGRG